MNFNQKIEAMEKSKMKINKLEKITTGTLAIGLMLMTGGGAAAVAEIKYGKYLFGAGVLLTCIPLMGYKVSYDRKVKRMRRENQRSYRIDSE